MIAILLVLGIVLTPIVIIFVFGVIGVKGSERWFPWP